MIQSHIRSLTFGALVISVAVAASACSSRNGAVSDTTTAAATALPPSAPGAQMDANHEFLRKMSDDHRGLILIVHQAVDRKDAAGVMATAKQLDTEQDAEMDTMTIMLRQKYNDPYDAQVMPEHQAMADSLKTLRGAAYDRAFRQDVIRHHQEAVAMVNEYLPRLTDPKIKTMAERMRVTQTREIAQMREQLSH